MGGPQIVHRLLGIAPQQRQVRVAHEPLPTPEATADTGLDELRGAAIIREVHVYGPVVRLGDSAQGEAQHLGLCAGLIVEAARLARAAGYARLAVISAVGTREYYRKQGFEVEGLYMTKVIGNW